MINFLKIFKRDKLANSDESESVFDAKKIKYDITQANTDEFIVEIINALTTDFKTAYPNNSISIKPVVRDYYTISDKPSNKSYTKISGYDLNITTDLEFSTFNIQLSYESLALFTSYAKLISQEPTIDILPVYPRFHVKLYNLYINILNEIQEFINDKSILVYYKPLREHTGVIKVSDKSILNDKLFTFYNELCLKYRKLYNLYTVLDIEYDPTYSPNKYLK